MSRFDCPFGGAIYCEEHQLAICWMENGVLSSRCVDPPRSPSSSDEFKNWVLQEVTGVPRRAKQTITARELQILERGRYEDPRRRLIVTFRLPDTQSQALS